MNKIEKIIEEIELDYIEFTNGIVEERKKLLPLVKQSQIKGLIHNLLTSEKWKSQISYNEYSEILDIWFNRIVNQSPRIEIKERKKQFVKQVININYDNKNILLALEVLNINGTSFIEYWTERGENDRKMRYEKQVCFDIKRRLLTWKNNNYNNAKPTYTDKVGEYLNR